jgi:hypothetical protein
MYRRIVAGTVAGVIATVPQSAVVWGLRRLGVYRSRAAPLVATDGLTERITGSDPPLSLQLVQHFAIGGAGGAVCGVTRSAVRPGIIAGLLTGLSIWAVSYRGLLPALEIMPPVEKDERGRAVTMFAAHVVYGAVMGWLTDRFSPSK